MANFTMWMMPILSPGIWITPLLASLMGSSFIAVNMFMIDYLNMNAAEELVKISFCTLADICSAMNFLVILMYNYYGPNKSYMYVIQDLTDEQIESGGLKIMCLIL